jgi:hypothetical protein
VDLRSCKGKNLSCLGSGGNALHNPEGNDLSKGPGIIIPDSCGSDSQKHSVAFGPGVGSSGISGFGFSGFGSSVIPSSGSAGISGSSFHPSVIPGSVLVPRIQNFPKNIIRLVDQMYQKMVPPRQMFYTMCWKMLLWFFWIY